jgi:hypothetical protein
VVLTGPVRCPRCGAGAFTTPLFHKVDGTTYTERQCRACTLPFRVVALPEADVRWVELAIAWLTHGPDGEPPHRGRQVPVA